MEIQIINKDGSRQNGRIHEKGVIIIEDQNRIKEGLKKRLIDYCNVEEAVAWFVDDFEAVEKWFNCLMADNCDSLVWQSGWRTQDQLIKSA